MTRPPARNDNGERAKVPIGTPALTGRLPPHDRGKAHINRRKNPACEAIAVDLSAYYDGELEGDRTTAVEAHLSDCAACRSQLDKMAKLSNALRAIGNLGAPKRPLIEELLRELDKEDRKQENNTSSA
ncbi:MAG: zf-HC2 domain-containing protein [SAR324 cluster bacterium]|nr:zf-HC2 domain-containing protein [SAR324 cluster bacterium]